MLGRGTPPTAAHHSQSRAPIQIGALTRIGVLGRELTMSNLSAMLHAFRFAIRIPREGNHSPPRHSRAFLETASLVAPVINRQDRERDIE